MLFTVVNFHFSFKGGIFIFIALVFTLHVQNLRVHVQKQKMIKNRGSDLLFVYTKCRFLPITKVVCFRFMSNYLREEDKNSPRASVIKQKEFSYLPPTLIIVAELDALRDGCYGRLLNEKYSVRTI